MKYHDIPKILKYCPALIDRQVDFVIMLSNDGYAETNVFIYAAHM